jgi:hypothetical protein
MSSGDVEHRHLAVPAKRTGMRRLWPAYGDDPTEPGRLAELIAARLREERPGMDVDDAFLHYCFRHPLENFRSFAGKYGWAFALLSLATIGAGLVTSGIAAADWAAETWGRIVILVLGLVAGIAATTNQIWRPGDKSTSRMRGANALRTEAWALLERRGRYRTAVDDREAFGLFVDEVSRILQQTAAVDEAAVEGPDAPT